MANGRPASDLKPPQRKRVTPASAKRRHVTRKASGAWLVRAATWWMGETPTGPRDNSARFVRQATCRRPGPGPGSSRHPMTWLGRGRGEAGLGRPDGTRQGGHTPGGAGLVVAARIRMTGDREPGRKSQGGGAHAGDRALAARQRSARPGMAHHYGPQRRGRPPAPCCDSRPKLKVPGLTARSARGTAMKG